MRGEPTLETSLVSQLMSPNSNIGWSSKTISSWPKCPKRSLLPCPGSSQQTLSPRNIVTISLTKQQYVMTSPKESRISLKKSFNNCKLRRRSWSIYQPKTTLKPHSSSTESTRSWSNAWNQPWCFWPHQAPFMRRKKRKKYCGSKHQQIYICSVLENLWISTTQNDQSSNSPIIIK